MADYDNQRWNPDNRWAGDADQGRDQDVDRDHREARRADEERSYGGRRRGGGVRFTTNQDIGYGQGSLATGAPAGTRAPGSFSDYVASFNGSYGDGYGSYGGPGSGRRPSQAYGEHDQGSYGRRADSRGYGPGDRQFGADYAPDDILERQARGEDPSFWGRMFGRDRHEGEHRGRGPKDYKRSDQRILEDVHDRLTDDSWLDAQDINVAVTDREVTLTGTVMSRDDKRRAEQLAESVSGVDHVQNNLRVARRDDRGDTTPLPQV